MTNRPRRHADRQPGYYVRDLPFTPAPSEVAGNAIIYARSATSIGAAIDAQVARCEDYVRSRGLQHVATLVDRAGANGIGDRGGLAAVFDAAQNREFGVLVVDDFERVTRDQEVSRILFLRLKVCGVAVHVPSRGQLQFRDICISSLMADEMRVAHRQRVAWGLRLAAQAGRATAPACFGYSNVEGETGLMAVDEAGAAVVRRAFELRGRGLALGRVAAELNRMPAAGKTWTPSGVGRLLRNPLYGGTLVHGRTMVVRDAGIGRPRKVSRAAGDWTVVTVEHLRIVDQALWQAVQVTFAASPRPA